jgi:outer membrane receptor protein involved in Fe transport
MRKHRSKETWSREEDPLSQVSKQRVRALKLGASSGAMLMALAMAGAAAAQEAPAPATDDTAVEEVVVTGFRASAGQRPGHQAS